MQQFNLIGRVGKQAEVRVVGTDSVIAFRVAVNERRTTSSGEKQEVTTWYKISQWKREGQSTRVSEYLTVGQLVAITGKPSVESYQDSQGAYHAEIAVRVERLELLGSPGRRAESGSTAEGDQSAVSQGDPDHDLPF